MNEREYFVLGADLGNCLGQIRSLGVIGVKPIALLVTSHPHICNKSRYIKRYECFDSASDAVEWLITNYGSGEAKHFIYADSDAVVMELDKRYNELIKNFYFFNGGGNFRLTKSMHKQELCRMAQECGLRVPYSVEHEIGHAIPPLPYPVFTKAASSFKDNWKADAHICHSEEELKSALEDIGCGKVLIQEYIDKKDEYILQGMSLDGGDKIFLPIQGGYYRLQPGAYGTFLHFEHYQGGDDLKRGLRGIMKMAHFTGIFEAEFLVNRQDRLYFLEVNFRQTAWNHTFTRMGVNLTRLFSEYMLNGTADFGARIKKEPFNLMNEIPDFLTYVGGRKLSLWKWLCDVRRTDAFQYFDKKDIRPFLSYFSATFSRKIKKCFRLV